MVVIVVSAPTTAEPSAGRSNTLARIGTLQSVRVTLNVTTSAPMSEQDADAKCASLKHEGQSCKVI